MSTNPHRDQASRDARARGFVAAALFASVLVVYAPVLGYPFLEYDDPDYVTENRFVRGGLTLQGLGRAFEPGTAGNWHPLTWLSHMLDVELYGLRAGFHHATSVLLHGLVAVQAFVLFVGLAERRLGAGDRAATIAAGLAAAGFALHPLRVESVAWISERKDVLSLALALAAVLTYLRYGERPSARRYAGVAALVAAALAAKSMAVTLPVLFLLLDVWPLGRLAGRPTRTRLARLALEKLPLALLAAPVALLTLVAQRRAGSVGGLDVLPLASRIGNALVALAAYLRDLIYPVGLAPLYPYPPDGWSAARIGASAALLALVSAVVWRARARHPWLVLGWLWFGIALVPVLGFVQVGMQARADRYTYLPQVGLFAAAAVEAAHFLSVRPRAARVGLVLAGATVVGALAIGTVGQLRFWRDTEILFGRALAVTRDNHVAHYALSIELVRRGQLEAGLAQALEAVRLRPLSARAQEQAGDCLGRLGRRDEALARLAEALRLAPDRASIHATIGGVLLEAGRATEAIAPLERAIALDPQLAAAQANLGLALSASGRPAEAVAAYERALALEPSLLDARLQLGTTLVGLGRLDEAQRAYLDAQAHDPADPRPQGFLAVIDLARGDFAAARGRAALVRERDPRMAETILTRVRAAEAAAAAPPAR